ncbi:MAG: integrase family protein [Alphaproteobacteria bacterium]|nr:integrase family protein [Alphaproteobacteria bacterium]
MLTMKAPKPESKVDEHGREIAKPVRLEFRDDLSPLWFRVASSGERTFCVRGRIKGQPQPIRLTYPERAHITNLAAAREWAVKMDGLCRGGVDPREVARQAVAAEEAARADDTRHAFEKAATAYLATGGKFKKNAKGWKPRTYVEYERAINGRLVPRWKGRVIHSITRDEILDFLSEIAETAPVAANRTLAVLGALMAWYQTQRGSRFTSPVVRGMAPTEEAARNRILEDDELRLVWHVAGKTGTFGSIVQMLLLTGARKSEIAAMRHSQIGVDGIWALPGEMTKNREPLYLPLSRLALRIIAAQPRTENQDIVFSFSGRHEFRNWGHNKADFDKRVWRRLKALARANGHDPRDVAPLPNWRLHDLRRTARSLMARAKVRPDHAERVLNHKIAGVEGTYDRHNYEDEKRDALDRLTHLTQQIVLGKSAKVVSFPKRAAKLSAS